MSSERSKHRLSTGNETPQKETIAPRERENHRRLSVPNDRSTVSIASYVEWVLVELTHEGLVAEYRSLHVWGHKRTQYVPADAYGETFSKRHYDYRLGWHEQTLSRDDLRRELVNRLSRKRPETSEWGFSDPIDQTDLFVVKPIEELRHRSRIR